MRPANKNVKDLRIAEARLREAADLIAGVRLSETEDHASYGRKETAVRKERKAAARR